MEHLLNCHGEWGMFASFLGTIPFLGVWIKSKLNSHKTTQQRSSHATE